MVIYLIINITSGICFLLIILILLYDFYSKKRLNRLENRYFLFLTYINLFGLILEIILSIVLIYNHNLNGIFSKLIYIYYLIFVANLFLYFYALSNKITLKENKKFKVVRKKISLIFSFLIYILLCFEVSDSNIFSLTDGSYFAYFCSMVTLIIIIFMLRKNVNNISKKNSFIILIILTLGFLSVVVQFYFSNILLIIPVHTIVILLIYFSLENPDLKLIKKLKTAQKKAENASNAKSDFLSNMSHEIRTPLNAIIGLSEAMIENEKIDNNLLEDIENINEASHLLLEIIGNVLDINKIESRKLKINNVNYSIQEELFKIVNINKEKIKNKDIEISVNINKNVPKYLYGDPALVKTIFTNYISNAVKYTKKGKIIISLNSKKVDNEYLIIFMVEDTGMGIKKSNQDKLFKKFSRVNLKENINIEGTGLGLVIVKTISTLLKGEVEFSSLENKGSIFTSYFVQGKSNKKIKEKAKKLNIITKKDILVVDDNLLNIKVLKRMLENVDVNITEANDGYECLEILKNNKFDLVFLDIMMPGINGIETLKKIKKLKLNKIKVIALTADATNNSKGKYLKYGFDDYQAKPYKKEDILKKLSD